MNWVAIPRYEHKPRWLYRLVCGHSIILYSSRHGPYIACQICKQFRKKAGSARIYLASSGSTK